MPAGLSNWPTLRIPPDFCANAALLPDAVSINAPAAANAHIPDTICRSPATGGGRRPVI
jgi:hypothetical protein